MTDKMRQLDEYLLDNCFERFARWTQSVSGLTCFFWAKLLTHMACVCLCVIITIMLRDNAPSWLELLAKACFVALFLFLVFIEGTQVWLIHLVERTATRQVMVGNTANGMRLKMSGSRRRGLVMCLWLGGLFSLTGYNLFAASLLGYAVTDTSAEYFLSCTPLPPGTSKVREFFRSLGRIRVPVPVQVKDR